MAHRPRNESFRIITPVARKWYAIRGERRGAIGSERILETDGLGRSLFYVLTMSRIVNSQRYASGSVVLVLEDSTAAAESVGMF